MSPRVFFLSLVCVGAALMQDAGWAQADTQTDSGALEGRWCFTADPFVAFGVQQTIFGEMELTQTAEDTFRCELWVEDHVPALEGDDFVIRADQSCEATREDDVLTIVSTVTRVDPPDVSYFPDDFTLDIESGSLMTGVMHAPPEPRAVFGRCVIA